MLFGLRRTDEGLTLQPRFPPGADGLRFSLQLPRENLVIILSPGPSGAAEVTLRGPGGEQRCAARFGDALRLDAQGRLR